MYLNICVTEVVAKVLLFYLKVFHILRIPCLRICERVYYNMCYLHMCEQRDQSFDSEQFGLSSHFVHFAKLEEAK